MKSLRRRILALGFAVNDAVMIYIAFKAAYWTRFEYGAFLNIFPALKGTPDWALYQAKREGRNCARLHTPEAALLV